MFAILLKGGTNPTRVWRGIKRRQDTRFGHDITPSFSRCQRTAPGLAKAKIQSPRPFAAKTPPKVLACFELTSIGWCDTGGKSEAPLYRRAGTALRNGHAWLACARRWGPPDSVGPALPRTRAATCLRWPCGRQGADLCICQTGQPLGGFSFDKRRRERAIRYF
jgi:hypothetical protein